MASPFVQTPLAAYLSSLANPEAAKKDLAAARDLAEKWLGSGNLTTQLISELSERSASDLWVVADLLLSPKVLRRTRQDSGRVAAQLPRIGRIACGVAAGTWISKRKWEMQWAPKDARTREALLQRAGELQDTWLCAPFAFDSDLSRAASPDTELTAAIESAASAASLGSELAIEVCLRSLVCETVQQTSLVTNASDKRALEGLLERAIDFRALTKASALPNPRLRDAIARTVYPAMKVGPAKTKKLLHLLANASDTLLEPYAESWAECLLVVSREAPDEPTRLAVMSRSSAVLILARETLDPAAAQKLNGIIDSVLSERTLDPRDEARLVLLSNAAHSPERGTGASLQGASLRALVGMCEGADADTLLSIWSHARGAFEASSLVQLISHVSTRLSALAEDSRLRALDDEWERLRDLTNSLRVTLKTLRRHDQGWALIDANKLADELMFRVPKPAPRRPFTDSQTTIAPAASLPSDLSSLAVALVSANEQGDGVAQLLERRILGNLANASQAELPEILSLAAEYPDFRLCLFRSVFVPGSTVSIEGTKLVLEREPRALEQWIGVAIAAAYLGDIFELPDALAAPVVSKGTDDIQRLAEAVRNPHGSPSLQLLYRDVARDLTQGLERVKTVLVHTQEVLTTMEGVLEDVAPRRH